MRTPCERSTAHTLMDWFLACALMAHPQTHSLPATLGTSGCCCAAPPPVVSLFLVPLVTLFVTCVPYPLHCEGATTVSF